MHAAKLFLTWAGPRTTVTSLKASSSSASTITITSRAFSNTAKKAKLINQHSDFLTLVGSHGEGNITMSKAPWDNRVAILTIANEAKKNAISGRMMVELAHIVDELLTPTTLDAGGPDALIIRAVGNTFCSGADLTLARQVVNTPERGLLMCDFMTDALNRLRNSGIVSCTALNGPAVGGGAELSTLSDFRVMTEANSTDDSNSNSNRSNYICFIHTKLGASPGWGGASRLANIVGRQHALRLLGTARRVSPSEAEAIGLVDSVHYFQDESSSSAVAAAASSTCAEITEIDPLMRKAASLLRPFLASAYPASVRAVKEIVAAAESESMQGAMLRERSAFGQRWASSDNRDALLVKR